MKKLINSFYFFSGFGAIIIILYFLQSEKKGSGNDNSTGYELVNNWPDLPKSIKLGNPTGLGTDTSQNIVVFQRAGREWSLFGSMPDKPIQDKTILIINRYNGNLINSWGDNLFIMPHGLTVDNENNIWVTDVGLHQVFKFSHEGKLLMMLGEAKVPGNDSLHFNKPTDIAIAKDGSFYVSDGYGNSSIKKFSATGAYLFGWGKKGSNEGEFNIPHAISLDCNGDVYVADRENKRIQVFNPNGRFIKQIKDNSFGVVCSVAFDKTKSKLFAVDDYIFLKVKHRGSDLYIFDTEGRVQTRFGRSGSYKGNVSWYHDLTVDKDENIYIADILGNTIQKFKRVVSR